ncbi:hypothetical protein [Kineococcus sp. G2]|uniref:hypothetical protein n=1 Tax=Kineococcus sp. G2 TaxID=3127484 RepID=UPI00301D7110
MTWAKIDDSQPDRLRALGLGPSARCLHYELTVWSCRLLTDGLVAPGALRVVGADFDDLEGDLEALERAGLVDVDDDGVHLVDFHDHQPTAADVEKARAESKARQDRSRRHRAGDHSTCRPEFCRSASVARDRTRDNGVSHDAPTRPDPSRPLGRDGAGRGRGAGAVGNGRDQVVDDVAGRNLGRWPAQVAGRDDGPRLTAPPLRSGPGQPHITREEFGHQVTTISTGPPRLDTRPPGLRGVS